jgi:hypothetical protein
MKCVRCLSWDAYLFMRICKIFLNASKKMTVQTSSVKSCWSCSLKLQDSTRGQFGNTAAAVYTKAWIRIAMKIVTHSVNCIRTCFLLIWHAFNKITQSMWFVCCTVVHGNWHLLCVVTYVTSSQQCNGPDYLPSHDARVIFLKALVTSTLTYCHV